MFRICRQENSHLFAVILQSFLTTMCRKVKLSIFISQRKCLINSKCYTKDPFSFTSLFISLKNALFLLLSCYHSTLKNTTCMLYHSAHPQIRLQPNTASPSLFKTNILSLLPACCSEDPTEEARIFHRYLTASIAQVFPFFQRTYKRLKCAQNWHTWQDRAPMNPKGHP